MIAWREVLDLRHVCLHEHDAATRGDLEVFLARGIRHGIRVKPSAFIRHVDVDAISRDATSEVHPLRFVGLVAVSKGVDHCLFNRQSNRKCRRFIKAESQQRARELILKFLKTWTQAVKSALNTRDFVWDFVGRIHVAETSLLRETTRRLLDAVVNREETVEFRDHKHLVDSTVDIGKA